LEFASKRVFSYIAVILLVLPVAVATLPPASAVSGLDQIAIILVEFPDAPHQKPIQYFSQEILPGMSAYYAEVSYGQYSLDGQVLGWFTLQRPLTDFNVTKRSAPDRGRLLSYTLKSIDTYVDFKEYDHYFIVYTGGVWAFQTDVRNYLFPGSRGYLTDDGAYITQLAVADESDGLYVYAHEFGHTLGLPDLYDYDRARNAKFIGDWDVMGSANYPVHFSAWSKIKLGWIQPNQITQMEVGSERGLAVTLLPLEVKTNGIRAIKLTIPRSSQYYLVELRLKIGYDTSLPGEGVLVTYVDETRGTGHGIVVLQTNAKGESYDLSPNTENVFVNSRLDFSVIIVQKRSDGWKIGVSSADNGFAAQRVVTAIFEADDAIDLARSQVRTVGLNDAEFALDEAWDAYANMNFGAAERFAADSINLAAKATYPEGYLSAKAMVEETEAKIADLRAAGFKAPLARILILEADQEIKKAREFLQVADVSSALSRIQLARNLIDQAIQTEQDFNTPSQEKPPEQPEQPVISNDSILVMVGMGGLFLAGMGFVVLMNRRRSGLPATR
jgi:M6 family metalloprotease-like protein